MKHTPEPWQAKHLNKRKFVIQSLPHECGIATTMAPINSTGTDEQENAERIVACINFCAGVSNEELIGRSLQQLIGNVEYFEQNQEGG